MSSKITDDQFVALVTRLNPENVRGKLLVVVRMGKELVKEGVHRLIKLKKEKNLEFLFVSDPMHGNTFQSALGDRLKTRNVKHILSELGRFVCNLRNLLKGNAQRKPTFRDQPVSQLRQRYIVLRLRRLLALKPSHQVKVHQQMRPTFDHGPGGPPPIKYSNLK